MYTVGTNESTYGWMASRERKMATERLRSLRERIYAYKWGEQVLLYALQGEVEVHYWNRLYRQPISKN
jgi:hypothetical protein